MTEPLSKVDSADQGAHTSTKDKASRKSSSVPGVPSVKEMYNTKTPLKVSVETQKSGWKINTSSTTVEDKDILTRPLVTPLVRVIDLQFPLGTVVTARNKFGVTIKDAMDAIYKTQKKKADDELTEPYLKGFEWPPAHPAWEQEMGRVKADEREQTREKQWGTLLIHLSSIPETNSAGGSKKKKKAAAEQA
ncbi:hypothetical protein GGR50DRAFT_693127 [Xylaria sp. CBS 124048]|nr:hypothetical protein GGR50DRAFT_693127 [Xylaria sp. CBS 124048]